MTLIDDSPTGMWNALERERAQVKPQVFMIISVNHATDTYLNLSLHEVNDKIHNGLEGYSALGAKNASKQIPWTGKVIVVDQDAITIALDICLFKPQAGEQVWLYEPDFQNKIRTWARLLNTFPDAYLHKIERLNRSIQIVHLAHEQDSPLRSAQRDAVLNAGKTLSLIWGPPGTGKTFTLGSLVRAIMLANLKVLALTTTNFATDAIALAVDDAFAHSLRPLRPGELIRPGLPQLKAIESREHLMKWTLTLKNFAQEIDQLREKMPTLMANLRKARSADKPLASIELAMLKQEIDAIKRRRSDELKTLLGDARIIVTTIAQGLSADDVLSCFGIRGEQWALVIDESSMVPRYVLPRLLEPDPALMVLAGDMKQLSPIRRSQGKHDLNTQYWIGDSIFDAFGASSDHDLEHLEKSGHLTMLTVQNRMNRPLCDVVSKNFYKGRLQTVGNPPSPPPWNGWARESIVCINPKRCPLPPFTPSGIMQTPTDQGKRWERSAWIAVGLAKQIVEHVAEHGQNRSVLLISPFRYQSWLLKNLVDANLSRYQDRVRVGTVHMCQGQEADIVIFDPVKITHRWLLGKMGNVEDIRRMMCVVFSRARSQVIVLGERANLESNPILSPLCEAAPFWMPPWSTSSWIT